MAHLWKLPVTSFQPLHTVLEEQMHFTALALGQQINALQTVADLLDALLREDERDDRKLVFLAQHLDHRQPDALVLQ